MGMTAEEVKHNLSLLMWAISNGYSDKIYLYCDGSADNYFSRVKIKMNQ